MQLARNVFYVSGAIIGAGVLLYFVIGVVSFLAIGGASTGRISLPRPMQLSQGSTYSVTPDCPMTIVAIGGTFPDRLFARVTSRIMGRDFNREYGVGGSVECTTPSGTNIEATIKGIDLNSVHFTFEWSH